MDSIVVWLRVINLLMSIILFIILIGSMRLVSGRLNTACKLLVATSVFLILQTCLLLGFLLTNRDLLNILGTAMQSIAIFCFLLFIAYQDRIFSMLCKVKCK